MNTPSLKPALAAVFSAVVTATMALSAHAGLPWEEGAANLWLKTRGYKYLKVRTQTFDVTPRRLIAALERDRIDPTYDISGQTVPDGAWDADFALINSLEDLRDFRLLDIMTIYLAYRDHPALDPQLIEDTEAAIQGFKYWLTDPTPVEVVDNTTYWTENHQITFYTLEYLAGGLFPDTTFTSTEPGADPNSGGLSGVELRARGKAAILRWLDRKARFGFNEFLSDVYYAATLRPLTLLVDFGEPEISTRASMVLDLLLLDLALNNQKSNFAGPRGRTFKKDKTRGGLQDTWDIAKVLFANTEFDFEQGDSVLYLIRSSYSLPKAIVKIGRHRGRFVGRQRMAIPAPNEAQITQTTPPAGFSYTDPADVATWWGMGAFVYWPVVPLTLTTLDENGLFDSAQFQQLAPFSGLVGSPDLAQVTAAAAAPFANGNILSEVNTYTFRTNDVMLSSAVGYRQGFAGVESHAWQATIDAEALVFTNHPFAPLIPSSSWADDFGYFTGEASWPRSGQIENVGIHIYAPQWPSPVLGFAGFEYQGFTHAFFPQDRFDEVVQEAGWTIGRKGDGYVALYSWRPATFKPYDPGFATDGMVKPFDLVAPNGADNVWIVEVGTAVDWGTFDQFRAAIVASQPQVVPLGSNPIGLSNGFDVTYDSPSQGTVSFGWMKPLVVQGNTVATGDFPRYDNPWSSTPYGSDQITVEYGRFGLALDFATGSRRLYRKGFCR